MDDKPGTHIDGLTDLQVKDRTKRGQANRVKESTSRTYTDIIRENIFTLFNAILGALFVIILLFGSINDSVFGLVLISNILIGIVQEVRAKRVLDRLSVLSKPKVLVIRDGNETSVGTNDVVLDDVIVLKPGDQIVVDGSVLISEDLEVDESLLTGESVPVTKAPDKPLFSGSFVVAGNGLMKATRVGAEAYARKLASEARHYTRTNSEIQNTINTILRYITWVIIPTTSILLLTQIREDPSLRHAVIGSAAGIIGMIPQGLVLISSAAFAVSVIVLGRKNVLVEQLPAVEILARVDTLCLDKTGTLTENALSFNRVEQLNTHRNIDQAIGALAALETTQNPTLRAIASSFSAPSGWSKTGSVPFSSARKWSGATFDNQGTWIIGAPEIILKSIEGSSQETNRILTRVKEIAMSGSRVLLLSKSSIPIIGDTIPGKLEPAALVVLEEKIRPDAAQTLKYFEEQGVTIKVISGDNPVTVAATASRAGMNVVGTPIDAGDLPEDTDTLAKIIENHSVFGRVTPHQKKQMIKALQENGHVVAMTGDGVNDALAIKDADLGIAMGSGAPATRSVAQLVLLDGKFSTLPEIVAEGRRVIANIERISNLFLTKTVYVTIITIMIALLGWPYPFLPRQLTFIDALTIGIPAFMLSFAPSKRRYQPGFLARVLRFTIPAGFIVALAALISYTIARAYPETSIAQEQTVATIALTLIGIWVLTVIARPLTPWRIALIAAILGLMLIVLSYPAATQFLALSFPAPRILFEAGIIVIIACILISVVKNRL